ncbi:MAG: TonB-dependent receptor [Flavobacteriaceae bacterium]|nr:TonB-dependent receptor [Flavobacteriaceae bacterium]
MKNTFIALVLTLFFFQYGIGQKNTGEVSGRIVNIDLEYLEGITIRLLDTPYATSTDENGRFYLRNVPNGNYTLQASGIGLTATKQNIEVNGKPLQLTLQLNEATSQLQEVVLLGNKRTEISSALTRTETPLVEIPQNVQIVEPDFLDDLQVFGIEQVYQAVPGITSAGYGAVNIRGFNTNSRSFLTNGLKGSPYPEGVEPLMANIERVEVLYGASSILYGQDNIGGNINLITKQPKKYTAFNASLSGGSFDLVRAMADITGSIDNKKSLYYLFGAAYQNGGRFTNDFDNENLQIYGSLKWEISAKTTFQFNGNFTRDRASSNYAPSIPVYNGEDPGLFSLPNDFTTLGPNSRYKGDSFQLQGILKHSFNDNWKGSLAMAYSESRANRQQFSTNGIDPQTDEATRSIYMLQLNSPTLTINPYINGKFSFLGMEHRMVAGLDITNNQSNYPEGYKIISTSPLNVLSPEFPSIPPSNPDYSLNTKTEDFVFNTVGGYVSDQISFSDKFKALLGLRYNNYYRRYLALNQDDSVAIEELPEVSESWIPRAGLVFMPTEKSSIYIDYNKGFIPQYSNYANVGGPFDPETSHQFELGYKGSLVNGNLQTTVALYTIKKENVLVFYRDENLPLGYGYRPLEAVRSKGMELGITGKLTRNLSILANYSFNETYTTESEDPADIGTTPNNSPKHTISSWLDYQVGEGVLKGLELGFGVNYMDERKAYFGSVPDYAIARALIGYSYKNYRLQINAENIFDRTYAVNGLYTNYTPGAPRSLLFTLSYSL